MLLHEPPRFIVPQPLGIQVAVGIPYDLFYVSGRYYLCRDRAWYVAPRYSGPWATVAPRKVPWELRRYPLETVRHFRDVAYRRDWAGNDRRDGRGEWHEPRRGHKDRWQEAKRWEREPARWERRSGQDND